MGVGERMTGRKRMWMQSRVDEGSDVEKKKGAKGRGAKKRSVTNKKRCARQALQ